MVFTSAVFVFIFLPVVLAGGIILRKHINISNLFLFFMSLIFYAWGKPKYVLLMLFSIICNYCLALLIEKTKYRNFWLIVAIFINIGVLFFFKYANWVLSIFNRMFNTSLYSKSMMLPIGISFYTFQALSYVIDVWKKKTPAQKSFIGVGLYIILFPQLVAGPIVRYTDIEQQIKERLMTSDKISDGIERFLVGFSKKILLADSFAAIADKVFLMNNENTLGMVFAWLGAIAYAMQIYFDFSGYSDMAIGLGKILGFSFPENFNYPYMASTITDFWRRWHISLSKWFRDYVYIPLGGNRHGTGRMIISLAITWLATGIWHGANVTFLIWGAIYGGIIILEKLLKLPEYVEKNRIYKMCYRCFSILLIIICWVIFRADNIREAFVYLKTMFCMKVSRSDLDITFLYIREYICEIMAGIAFCFPVGNWLKGTKSNGMQWGILLAEWLLFIVSVSYMVKGAYSPFIYFNF